MNRLLPAILLALTPLLAHGATYYVATTGSDGNSCAQARSASTPKLTIKAGLACLSSGDSLVIAAGTYLEGIDTNAIPSGTGESSRTIVRAAAPREVVLKPNAPGNSIGDVVTIQNRSYITLDGLILDGSNAKLVGLRLGNGVGGSIHHITFQNGGVRHIRFHSGISHQMDGGLPPSNMIYRNLEIYDIGNQDADSFLHHGLYLCTSDSLVENCTIHDSSGHGIHQFHQSSSDSHRNVIRNNRIYNNGSYAILLGSGTGNIAYNNIVWGNGKRKSAGGIWIAYNARGNKICNNTIFSNTGDCVRVRTDQNALVRNNICWQNSTNIIDETGTAVISNNLFTNPSFVDALRLDFTLSANSPALNNGVPISEVQYDFNRVPRPQGVAFDVGAFEGSSASSAPTNLRVIGDR